MAMDAHRGQVDKGGAPYIFHPIRVAMSVNSDTEKIVALLHDTLEDTALTRTEIRDAFGGAVLGAVENLTKIPEETYDEYIDRVCDNPFSKNVKMADLRDNMDIMRLSTVTTEDVARIAKYRKYYDIIKEI